MSTLALPLVEQQQVQAEVQQQQQQLLGQDGLGYELAKKLESSGSWKDWLGEQLYSQVLSPHLACASSWKNFMSPDPCKSRAELQVQMRVRALLFDKASVSLYSPQSSIASLPPSYLQLHADDIYYSLEEDAEDWTRLESEGSLMVESLQRKSTSSNLKRSFSSAQAAESIGIRLGDCTAENTRYKNGELTDTWYSQWREKHLVNRMQRLAWRLAQQKQPFGERETSKRSPEGMLTYLKFAQKHRKRYGYIEPNMLSRYAYVLKDSEAEVHDKTTKVAAAADCLLDEQICFFPETMFPFDCVPDSSVSNYICNADTLRTETFAIFDNLSHGRSALAMERFGSDSEYLNPGFNTGKNQAALSKKLLSTDEALHLSKQTVAQIVASVGFDGLSEKSLDILSELLCCHIGKLGRILRLLGDTYRKHHSQTELLRMFLRSIGHSNFWTLASNLKAGSRLSPQAQQQLLRTAQTQEAAMLSPSQQRLLPRQALLQHPHAALAMQQQHWEKLRRKQPIALRNPGKKMDKDRIENNHDSLMDCKQPVSLLPQNHAHWQSQPIQTSQHFQGMAQYKPFASSQIPHMQHQNMVIQDSDQIRTLPVKVEAFQELMSGNISVKQEIEDEISRPLISPRK